MSELESGTQGPEQDIISVHHGWPNSEWEEMP